jgi:hypothetical protein
LEEAKKKSGDKRYLGEGCWPALAAGAWSKPKGRRRRFGLSNIIPRYYPGRAHGDEQTSNQAIEDRLAANQNLHRRKVLRRYAVRVGNVHEQMD